MAGKDDDWHLAKAIDGLAEAVRLSVTGGFVDSPVGRVLEEKLSEVRGHTKAVLNRYEEEKDGEEDA
jgi:hypothetical protein